MTDFVLDSSVTFAWFFEDERRRRRPSARAAGNRNGGGPRALVFRDRECLGNRRAPSPYNVWRVAEFIGQLEDLTIVVDSESLARAFAQVVDLARRERFTGYDAAYLELAMRLGVPLATKDVELATPPKGWASKFQGWIDLILI